MHMPSVGSYTRFILGIALSVEVLRDVIMGTPLSSIAVGLSVAFLALALVFIVFKF
jgi:hypothetical protein